MVSPALVVPYLFLVLVVVIIAVLCCLGCGCHVPLTKCLRCFCKNTTVCCNRCCKRPKKKGEGKFGNIIDDVNQKNADADEGRARKKREEDDESVAGCCSWIPYVLTCGMCCGMCSDTPTWVNANTNQNANTQVNSQVSETNTVVVAQPVSTFDVDEVVGTEHAVAVSIPLLAMG